VQQAIASFGSNSHKQYANATNAKVADRRRRGLRLFYPLNHHKPTSKPGIFAKHRIDIDGLRALAVLPVVLFHFGVGPFSGGFTGVDIFFTISGFVIAGSILNDIRAGSFSIANFYFKRIRRILPAYAAVMTVTTIAAAIILLPSDFADYGKSLVSTSTFASNFYFWKASGYFAAQAQTKLLLHTWSLSVEEQYYLFAPICFWAIYQYGRSSWLLFLTPLAILSFLVSVTAVFVAPTAGFFLFPTRIWELLLGAIIALSNRSLVRYPRTREIMSGIGLLMIVIGISTLDESDPFPGWNALLPCLGTGLIIQAGMGGEPKAAMPQVNRVLSWRPFVWIGLISYSLYLVHWPIVSVVKYLTLRNPTTSEAMLMLVVSIGLAWVSWRFIEQPFRKISREHRPKAFVAATCVILGGILIGSSVSLLNGLPQRFPDFVERHIEGVEDWGGDHCFNQNPSNPTPWDPQLCTRVRGGNGKILVWGDSFAAQYFPGILRDSARINADVLQYTFAGCPPILSYFSYARVGCTEFNRRVPAIIRDQHIDTVVLAARWTDTPHRTLNRLGETIASLRQLDIRIVVIGQSPQFIADVQHIDYISGNYQHPGEASWRISFSPSINKIIASQIDGATMIDPLSFLCEQTTCRYREDRTFLYADFGHFSTQGSLNAVRAFFPVAKSQAATGAH
jgi:peptidoglycan/LPS O-acetylase OafA/YrhL